MKATQNLQILPIAKEHAEGFHRCLDSVARERLYLAQLQAPPLDSTRAFVLSNIAGDVPQFVAVMDNEVVGWCDISPMKREGFTHCGELGMGVHQRYRRLGIGQQLIAHTIQKAKEIGLERIELEVFASNIPAIKLYEKLGFVTEGVKKKARKMGGNYDDIVEMALFV
jgi:ribosomal protein S18 acetylase RimI-like enzyme